MNIRQSTFAIVLCLLSTWIAATPASAQSMEELMLYAEVAEMIQQGYVYEALVILDELNASSKEKPESEIATFFRIVIYAKMNSVDQSIRVLNEYKRTVKDGQGEVHDAIIGLEPTLIAYQKMYESLGRVENSSSARQLALSYAGTEFETELMALADLYTRSERLSSELSLLPQKRYAADIASVNAEGPIYGGMIAGLGGWLFLELLAEDKELKRASSYFLLAGGAVVAYGFYKLIHNQNKFVEYGNRMETIETELANISLSIDTKKMNVLSLFGL